MGARESKEISDLYKPRSVCVCVERGSGWVTAPTMPREWESECNTSARRRSVTGVVHGSVIIIL